MRDLKFRAWNVEEKCWVKEFYPLFNGYDEGRGGHWMEGVQGDKDEDLMVSNKEVIICQYTGLKDKNGKEIYEGDILLADEDYTDGEEEIKLEIRWDAEKAGFYLYDLIVEDGADDDEFYALNNCYKVTGNIYENTELLKEVK